VSKHEARWIKPSVCEQVQRGDKFANSNSDNHGKDPVSMSGVDIRVTPFPEKHADSAGIVKY
jgi:hypothetical protein